jgi:hypothetical protein
MHTTAARTYSSSRGDLTRLDRIVLHLRCVYHDHKYRWHLAGGSVPGAAGLSACR